MGEFQVRGTDAGAFLDRLLVNAIAAAPAGKAVYSPMCAEDGTVVDDLIVYCIAANDYLVCVNAGNIEKDLAWFQRKAAEWELDVEILNRSEDFALLALQGPLALDILAKAVIGAAHQIKRFNHLPVTYSGSEIRICRTGYTGEDGVEIYIAPDAAEGLAEALLGAGQEIGLKLCGLGARDSLRLEAGFPLYGHELSDAITPLQAGLSWTVKFKKADFVGKAALAEQKKSGLPSRVVFFTLEGRRIAREGAAVLNEAGESVGRVLSGTLSPMMGTPIGSALVKSEALEGELYVDLRGNKQALKQAKPPLHQ